jgi:hypothetical protein
LYDKTHYFLFKAANFDMLKREEAETNFQSFPSRQFFIAITLRNLLYTQCKLQILFFNVTGVFVGQRYLGLLNAHDSFRGSL